MPTPQTVKNVTPLFFEVGALFITSDEYYFIFTLLCMLSKASLQGRRQPLKHRKLYYTLYHTQLTSSDQEGVLGGQN